MFVEGVWLGLERRNEPGRIARHCHDRAYAALVVSGGYYEAGDGGRRWVQDGDVLVHGRYEAHQNAFNHKGALILNLPCAPDMLGCTGRTDDPDLIVRIAERDPYEAMSILVAELQSDLPAANDWPDELAKALERDHVFSLTEWAERAGLSPSSLSRGFRLAFGVSPQRYRADRRACRAVQALASDEQSLTQLAAELGFADQAHMSREVLRLTGAPPSRWRAENVNCVQGAARPEC